ncbi:MAG: 3-phosphoshikimate 1-carboxyvinyltransferase [Vulcanimicrobiaceae bacterium]
MHLLVKGTNGPLAGEVLVPNSKYHAHRALILASLALGTSRVLGLSDALHVQYTVQVLRALGTGIEVDGDTFVVHGGAYVPNRTSVSVGSSGSTLYFMIGLASLANAPITLTAQKYLRRRPVGPLLDALSQMGIRLHCACGYPPVAIWPGRPSGGKIVIPGTLSQWISGLLLVAPFARDRTVIDVEGVLNERPYIDLTVQMMRLFGLHVEARSDARHFEIAPNQEARPANVTLPPDIGSAAFGLAATAIHPSNVLFRGLTQLSSGLSDHPEAHFLDIVRGMGLPMELDEREHAIRVRHDGIELRPAHIDCREIPDMLPILATLGSFAKGTTVLENVAHIRLKESDRVTAMLQLNRMGGRLDQDDNRLICHGVDRLVGARLSSFNDHRVLMSLAVAASRAQGQTTLTYPNAYRISYPRFLDAMRSIGIPMSVDSTNSAKIAAHRAAIRDVFRPDCAAQTHITERVQQWARERPADIAIVDVREERVSVWSWDELTRAADRTAMLLLDLGVRPGEPVAFQLPNWAEFVIIALATLRIGAVCCPLMPIFREREVALALQRSRARVLFVPDRFRGRDYPQEVAALSDEACALDFEPPVLLEHVVVIPGERNVHTSFFSNGLQWHRFDETTRRYAVDFRALAVRCPKPTAIAQLLFTSGTSGEPKGVLHRLDALTRAAAMEAVHLGLGADDRVYIPSPLAHQTGFLYGMWLAFLLGVPQIVQDIWEPVRALRALLEWDGTFVQAATPFLADLVRAVEGGREPPAALRIFVATGAAVPRGLAERATRVLGTAVCGAWGTTESCLGTLSATGDEPAKMWGTDGRALNGVRIRVTDDAGHVLPPSQEGNFEVSSHCLFEGYIDHPEWTAAAFTPDGWFRTGDLAVIDDTGYIRISGRVKDIINRGGEKIPVAEVEQLLYEHPAIAEIAIVAMPDERLGERACAFVVPKGGTSVDFAGMQRYLDVCQVAKQYWPEHLEIVAELPRNATGKIQKYVLREWAKAMRADRDKEHVS